MNKQDPFIRNKQLLDSTYNKIKNKHVAIIGLGGVGGFALESIARLGVNNIIICDYDKVNASNINRQIIANKKTINKKKTNLFKKRLKNINPNIKLVVLDYKIDDNNLNILFDYKIDFLIDAIDTIFSKASLLKEASKRKIPSISCLAMGNKTDPTKIKIDCFNKAIENKDPLALKIKKINKQDLNCNYSKFIFSTQTPIKKKRPPSSIVLTPSVAGIYCAYEFLDYFSKQA